MSSVCFRVTGAFLTDHHRNLVREGAWQQAIQSFIQSLHGIDWDIAISILSGKKKLIGESGNGKDIPNTLDLADEVPEEVKEYLDAVNFVYGGAYRETLDRWYRPYAVVTNYGINDLPERHSLSVRPDYPYRRALHYADTPNEDIVHALGYNGYLKPVLFKKCAAPPMWLEVTTRPEIAFQRYCEIHGGVAERGHAQAYGSSCNEFVSCIHGTPTAETYVFPALPQNLDQEAEYHEQLQERIRVQAEKNGGFFDLVVPYKNNPITYSVPYEPFKAWALNDYWTTTWIPVSPEGYKMACDSPIHTDWIVGAGIPIDSVYDHDENPLQLAIWDKVHEIVEAYNKEFTVISGNGKACGKVVHIGPLTEKDAQEALKGNEIIIIPSLHPTYLSVAKRALAIISEQGGALSHLAQEHNLSIMRIHDARKKYLEGNIVTLDFDNNRVLLKEAVPRT